MGKQTNNPDKKLKEFLDKNKNSAPADDLFDREALEGFALLDNEQEALDLKADLDGKMNKKFFGGGKKMSRTYWLAAAGFILVIGLSVYFIGNFSTQQNKDLAISNIETPSQTEPMVSENSDQAIKHESLELKPDLKKGNELTISTNQAATKKAPEPTKMGYSQTAAGSKNLATDSTSVSEKNSEGFASVQAAKPVQYKVQNEPADEAAMDKNEEEQVEKKVAESRSKRKAMKKDDEKSPAAGAPETVSTYDADLSGPKKEKAVPGIFYPGGEVALNKILKEKLVNKESDQDFDAVLFINKQGQVEKAEFTKIFELSGKQQKRVIAILESLEKFRFQSKPPGEGLTEYRVIYRK